MTKGLTYKAAGVDIELKEGLVDLFKRMAQPTLGRNIIAGIGGFGALISLDGTRRMRSPVLVASTDGVGTKLKIAFAIDKHDTVGIDCVAMCVNDIICTGARPLFFLDYVAVGKLDEHATVELVKGIVEGCRQAGASLVGGETAQLPGMYRPGEYDLAGFAVGIAERAKIPVPVRTRPGDVLVGFASSGLHSNGFSLARKALLERGRLKLGARIAELGCSLGEELLRPTFIYARLCEALFRRFKIKGLANITGGGIPENLPRILPPGLCAAFARGSWPAPPIFSLIARTGRIEQDEMDRAFNNGLGMVAIVSPVQADGFVTYARMQGYGAYIVGEVRRGERQVIFD